MPKKFLQTSFVLALGLSLFSVSLNAMLPEGNDSPNVNRLVQPLQNVNLNRPTAAVENPPQPPNDDIITNLPRFSVALAQEEERQHALANPFPTPPLQLVVTDDDSEDDDNYRYQPPQSPRRLDLPPSFEDELKSINSQLAASKYPNFSEHTPFLIPFYRGVHYLQELFHTDNDRRTHRHNARAGIPLFCSAAYALLGKTFLDQNIDKILLEKNARHIAKILGKFKTNYPQEYYKFHELYSNDHLAFHRRLENVLALQIGQPLQQLDPLRVYDPFDVYKGLFNETIGFDTQAKHDAFKRNPFVSCSMTIKHALKYSFGLKSFNGTPLEPAYIPIPGSPHYQPTHPYLGMLYTILLDPLNLLSINPTSIIGAQQQRQLQVSYAATNNILSEYEVSFFGWIPPQYVCSTMPVRVPNFKRGLQAYHQDKYGVPRGLLTLDRENIFKKKSNHMASIIKRKVQDELTAKYPHSPVYQAYWRPDGKFGPSLISTTTVLALREPNISLFPNHGKQKIYSADLEYLGEMLLTFPQTQIEVRDYTLQLPLLTPIVISSLEQSLQRGLITHLTLRNMGSNNLLKTKPMFWSKLLHNNNLQYLDLSSNGMGTYPLSCIFNQLFHNSHLKTLKIANNAEDHLPASHLALALIDNNTLTELDYSSNKVCSNLPGMQDGVEGLCNGLSQNSTLKKLNLSGNFINNAHCASHLTKLTNLTELNLSNNNITNNELGENIYRWDIGTRQFIRVTM